MGYVEFCWLSNIVTPFVSIATVVSHAISEDKCRPTMYNFLPNTIFHRGQSSPIHGSFNSSILNIHPKMNSNVCIVQFRLQISRSMSVSVRDCPNAVYLETFCVCCFVPLCDRLSTGTHKQNCHCVLSCPFRIYFTFNKRSKRHRISRDFINNFE